VKTKLVFLVHLVEQSYTQLHMLFEPSSDGANGDMHNMMLVQIFRLHKLCLDDTDAEGESGNRLL